MISACYDYFFLDSGQTQFYSNAFSPNELMSIFSGTPGSFDFDRLSITEPSEDDIARISADGFARGKLAYFSNRHVRCYNNVTQ